MKSKFIGIRVSEDMFNKLHDLSKQSGKTMTEIVSSILDYYVDGLLNKLNDNKEV
jgi:predicted DNA-binding protein